MPWSTAASSSGDGQLRVMGLRMTVRSLGSVRVNVVGGRPIDSAIFDDYCNRIGRKSTLIATLMLMRIATLPHPFVPSRALVGIRAKAGVSWVFP
jgi:hypothetical protein